MTSTSNFADPCKDENILSAIEKLFEHNNLKIAINNLLKVSIIQHTSCMHEKYNFDQTNKGFSQRDICLNWRVFFYPHGYSVLSLFLFFCYYYKKLQFYFYHLSLNYLFLSFLLSPLLMKVISFLA